MRKQAVVALVPGGAEGVVHAAGVGGAELEPLARVDPHGVEEVPADELHARDARLGRVDVALEERDAVDGRLEVVAAGVAREGLRVVEAPDSETLAGAVVLGDERRGKAPGGLHERLPADRGHRLGGADAARLERRVLRDLADLEREGAAGVDDMAAVPLEPGQDGGGVLGSITMAAGVRRGAHPVVEDAVRGWHGEVERGPRPGTTP